MAAVADTSTSDARALIEAQRAEIESLRRELEATRADDEIARVLFEQSSDAHLIFDDSGIIDCNHAAVKMLLCEDKSQVLNLHPAVLSPERQPDGRRSLEKSVEMDGRARREGYHRFEWIHRRMNGELFPVEVTLTPVQISSGPALLVVWHELTEIKQAESTLREQLDVIVAQRAEIARLSMPLIEVAAGVLMAPVLGTVDRAALAGQVPRILEQVTARATQTLIVDLTGLQQVDAETGELLTRTLAAVSLLGVEGVLVGISPSVAQQLVELGAALQGVKIYRSVREALARLGDS